MRDLLNFLELYSLERNFYTVVNDIYNKGQWEIYWNKHQTNSLWGLKNKASDSAWYYYNVEEFVGVVHKHSLDAMSLERDLMCCIKSLIAYTFILQGEASRRFGDELLIESQKEFDDFARNLVQAVNKVLEPNIPSKPLLQLIK